MNKFIFIFALVFSSFAFASDCFNSRQVRSWSEGEKNDSLIVHTRNESYLVETYFCSGLSWARQIGFRSFFTGRVCRGDEVIVIGAFNEIEDVCRIKEITKQ